VYQNAELANLFPPAERRLDFAVILEDVVRALTAWAAGLIRQRSEAQGGRVRLKDGRQLRAEPYAAAFLSESWTVARRRPGRVPWRR
jgi:hypothetical protein